MDENQSNNVNQENKATGVSEVMNTADHTSEFNPQDIANNKVMAVLAYLNLLVLVPIFAAKDSPYARFHANQGLVIFIINAILTAASILLGRIPLVPLIIWIANIAVFVLAIIGIINAASDKAKDLPLIGGIKILK